MKFFRYLLVAIVSFVAAVLLLRAPAPGAVYLPELDPTDTAQPSSEYTTYYEQLSQYQKNIYDALLPIVSGAETEVTFQDVNLTDFKNNCYPASLAIQYDHPEYFWFTGGYSTTSSHLRFSEKGKIVWEPIYYAYVSELFNAPAKAQELTDAVAEVAALAQTHTQDPYEQVLFVHDYLIQNARYDKEALEEYYQTSHTPSCEYIFSAYGCLVDGKTVCSGYAKAFQLVMRQLGLDCTYVTGDAGGPHGWSCVFLDGEGYYVDVTWDDLDLETEAPVYNYALITSEALSRTHQVDMEFAPPVCNATQYNYFLQSGYYTDLYQFDTAAAILAQQCGSGALHIQFGSLDALGSAYGDLYDNRKYKDIPGIGTGLKFYYNEAHRSLTIFE